MSLSQKADKLSQALLKLGKTGELSPTYVPELREMERKVGKLLQSLTMRSESIRSKRVGIIDFVNEVPLPSLPFPTIPTTLTLTHNINTNINFNRYWISCRSIRWKCFRIIKVRRAHLFISLRLWRRYMPMLGIYWYRRSRTSQNRLFF